VIASLLCCLSLLALDPPAEMNAGDEAFYSIDYPDAISRYETALRVHAGDSRILWRLARVFVCTGEVAEGGARDTLFHAAERYARLCIAADSTVAEGHTWLAGALGYLALDAPAREQLDLTRELLHEVDRALALNADDDVALSIQGSCFRALGNIGWLQRQLASLFIGSVPSGGYREAETALKKAIALAPLVMRHVYELAVLYLDWGRKEEARAALEHAATLPVRTAIDRPRLEKIKALLDALGEKH
jgi:tetratricopeptide (TPR) repeat protein